MQVNQLIRQQFPGTEVVGSNYPPAATNVALSKLVGFGTMVGLSLPGGVGFVTWPGGCQIGYMEHTGCHQLNRVLTTAK
jgi:hypothetical protein